MTILITKAFISTEEQAEMFTMASFGKINTVLKEAIQDGTHSTHNMVSISMVTTSMMMNTVMKTSGVMMMKSISQVHSWMAATQILELEMEKIMSMCDQVPTILMDLWEMETTY